MGRTVPLVALMLIVAVLLLGGLMVLPLVSRSAPPPPWRVELEHYLAYRATLGKEQVSEIATAHATQPWLFG